MIASRFSFAAHRRWSFRVAASVALLVACATPTLATTGEETTQVAPEPAPVKTTANRLTLEPPDGQWQSDEEGRNFYTVELAKEGLQFQRVDAQTVRLKHGPFLRVHEEDGSRFVFRIYQRGSGKPPQRPEVPTPEQIAESAKDFVVDVATADRIALVPFDNGLPRRGMWRNGFDLADMNGDGHLDLLHGPPRKSGGGPVVFLGDGAGNWTVWRDWTLPEDAPYDYGDVAAADFDGDGHTDFVMAMHMTGLFVLRNDGEGNFAPWTEGVELEWPDHKGQPAFTSRSVETADWDGDGDHDIVALSEGPRGLEHVQLAGSNGIVRYMNQGDGTWKKVLDNDTRIFGDAVNLGDVNGDGRLDAVTSSSVGGQRKLVRLGEEGGGWRTLSIDEIRPGAVVWTSTIGDFDGDGRDDVVYGYSNTFLGVRRTGIDVLYARDDETWERRGVFVREERPSFVYFHALDTGDLDGDGALDLVAIGREGETFLFLGDGEGFLVAEEEPELATKKEGCRGFDVQLEDLNGDGRDEIVAAYAGESCTGLGSLRAWAVEPKVRAEAGESAAGR